MEPGVATIQVWSRERSSDFNSSRFFLNGTEQDKKETVNPSLFPLDTNPFTSIGAGFTEFGSFLPFNGKIGEIIIVENTSDEIRQNMEGFLAHKWGLSDKLPDSHPHKDSFEINYIPPASVFQLNDQSGNSNHARQSTEKHQPGLLKSSLNGKDIVLFDGDDFLTFDQPINSIRTLFLVAKEFQAIVVSFLGIHRIMDSKLENPQFGNSSLSHPIILMILIFPLWMA